MGRFVSLLAFLPVASRVPDYARLIGALVLDDRMPSDRKVLLGAAAGYLVIGRDLVPDSVPLIGGLDDIVVRRARRRRVPRRRAARVAPGEARGPSPSIRLVRPRRRPDPTLDARTRSSDHPATPGLVTAVGHAIDRSGIVPRARAWITKGSPALEGHPDQGPPQAWEERRAQAGRRRLRDELLIPRPAAGRRRGVPRVEHDIASREDKRKREREEAEIAATRISSTTLTMGVKVGEGGKLYGRSPRRTSPTRWRARDRGRSPQVELEEPLKSLGTYKVAVKVFTGMTPEVTVVVEPKG